MGNARAGEPSSTAVAHHLDGVHTAFTASLDAPRRGRITAKTRIKDAAVAFDLVFSYEAIASPMATRADAALKIVIIAADQHRKLRLEQLDRIVVGVAVGDRDQSAGPVPLRGRAPAAVLRLDVDKQPIGSVTG